MEEQEFARQALARLLQSCGAAVPSAGSGAASDRGNIVILGDCKVMINGGLHINQAVDCQKRQ